MGSGHEGRSKTLEIRYGAKTGMVLGVKTSPNPLLLCPIPLGSGPNLIVV